MKIRYPADQVRFQRMNTAELRESYLIEDLFVPDSLNLIYSDLDRAIVGSAVPTNKSLELSASKELASDYFTQRREIGVINVGGKGIITVDGQSFTMENRDGLYIGRGSKKIVFSSDNKTDTALFYLLSYPAHREFPAAQAKIADAEAVNLGSKAEANERTIFKYIHPGGIKSCQLVMGFTELAEGSVWNTMPAHTHERRTEVYMYFDVPEGSVVFHFMGMPDETRHLVMRNRQAVLSPSWSIHAGSGTNKYCFIWGMGGENQEFADMDGVGLDLIR